RAGGHPVKPLAWDDPAVIQPLIAYSYGEQGDLTGRIGVQPEVVFGELWYRLPKRSTLVHPIDVEPGCVAVFLERTQSWISVADHRGEVWFDWKDQPVPINPLRQ